MTNDEILARNEARAEEHSAASDKLVRLKAESDKVARRLIEDGVDIAGFTNSQYVAAMAKYEAEQKALTDSRTAEERSMRIRELSPEQV